jgi:hypothetical protein
LAVFLSIVGLGTFFLPVAFAPLTFLDGSVWPSLPIASDVPAVQLQALKAHHDDEFPYVVLFFALLLVLMLIFIPGPLPAKPLGAPRKRFSLAVIVLGICTFVLPIVNVSPSVLNRTQWSAFYILSAVYAAELPVAKGHFDQVLADIALLYALMPFALGAVFLPKSPKPLTVISFVGFVVSSAARFWHLGFMFLFDNWEPGGVKIGLAGWILPWIMPALFALCFAKSLDVEDDLTDPVAGSQPNRR